MTSRRNAPSCLRTAGPTLSRRGFLQGAGALAAQGAVGWAPLFQVTPGAPRATLPPPPAFPAAIPVYQQAYRNWCGEILVEGVWTAAPRSEEDVATLVNWARGQGWRVRAKGRSHGWSPLLLPQGASGARYLLVDTTQHLTAMRINPLGSLPTVTAQTGISLDSLLEALGAAGLGFTGFPAAGCVTLGGALAINGHGSAIRGVQESPLPGKTYGSLTNAVLALTAVVWDKAQAAYVLRSFQRDDPAIGPLLVHLGRAFITQVTLQVGPDVNLRCRSFTTIPASTLFAPPERAGSDSLGAWARSCGRVEAVWFPFTSCPWLKVWSIEPVRPWFSLELRQPYPFTWANWVTENQSAFLQKLLAGDDAATPTYQALEMTAAASGLLLTGTGDVWGPSRLSSLHVQPSTLRVSECGYAVLTRVANIQKVVSEFATAFSALLERYALQGLYPVNGPVDIRVTGLDQAGEVMLPDAVEPSLSALRPWQDRPDWDCAVWLCPCNFPGTPHAARFFTELEAWILAHFRGEDSQVRVEWSKGWAYSPEGPWTNPKVLQQAIPDSLEAWNQTLAALEAYDPHGLFGNAFLDAFLS